MEGNVQDEGVPPGSGGNNLTSREKKHNWCYYESIIPPGRCLFFRGATAALRVRANSRKDEEGRETSSEGKKG